MDTIITSLVLIGLMAITMCLGYTLGYTAGRNDVKH